MLVGTHSQYKRKYVENGYFIKIHFCRSPVGFMESLSPSKRGCYAAYFSFSQVVLRLHD